MLSSPDFPGTDLSGDSLVDFKYVDDSSVCWPPKPFSNKVNVWNALRFVTCRVVEMSVCLINSGHSSAIRSLLLNSCWTSSTKLGELRRPQVFDYKYFRSISCV